jgi:hypothetical protein
MALSPQYSWPEPDNSSLVKNGAQDIRALGDAIDTSVWNVGYGQASKNKFINGNFAINQRSFTSQVNGTGTFGFDRWKMNGIDGTTTFSAQTFTPGTAPVAGYESTNYLRIVTTSQTATNAESDFFQAIEDVRTFAGQTTTISFWAKANSGTPKMAVELRQNFGSGGSSVVSTPVGFVTISTSWARYSLTVNVPSVSGKTIGAGSAINVVLFVSAGTDLNTRASSIGIQSNTFETWGLQVEYGSKATPFQTATGTIQGELAACQRYYWRTTNANLFGYYASGNAQSTTAAEIFFKCPVTMRVQPTALDFQTIGNYRLTDNVGAFSATGSLTLNSSSSNECQIVSVATSGLTQFRQYWFTANNNAGTYVGFSAEL